MAGDLPRVAPGTPIFDFVAGRLDPAGRLADPRMALPDEQDPSPDRMRWAAGARDGVFGHHTGGDDQADRVEAAVAALAEACRRPTRRRLSALYQLLVDDPVGMVDPLVEALVVQGVDRVALHRIGRWLATTAPDRGPVKIGIALLGVTGLGADVAVVRTLGAHEELTLFAAVAVTNGLAAPESELWALAASVDGWGRIQCVERLAGTTDPAIRDWILRTGFRNRVMDEYLAYIAATTGGLLDALRAPAVDRALLTAAGQILQALVQGGPAEDLDDYEDAADAVEAYLGHAVAGAETFVDYLSVRAVQRFLSEVEGWDERAVRGWSATRREAFERHCAEILGRPEWRDRAAVGLLADDGEFWKAHRVARHLGMDTFAVLVARIRADPFGGEWDPAWEQADRLRAAELVALVAELLPLDSIASGPGEALGLGPDWRPHEALLWSLQALRAHPGIGGELLVVGLQSPVVSNRNMALKALEAWPDEDWPAAARPLVATLATSDPRPKTRGLAATLDGRGRTG